jgi:hypothetical protein
MVLLDSLSKAHGLKCGVAVRISLNSDCEISFSDVTDVTLNSQLLQDICGELRIPTTGIHVILVCRQHEKLIAEVVFRELDEHLQSDISALAADFVGKVKDSQSAFHNTPLGRFSDDAEILGLVSLSVCETVIDSQRQMQAQMRMERSKVQLQVNALLQIFSVK